MKHNIISYLLGEGFRNVFHNKKSSGASLAIMCATMLIFGLFFIIIENINYFVETLESQQGMQVFIEKDATEAQVTEIGELIKDLDGVNTVTYVSKEEALNQVKEKLGDKQALIATWDEENPFRESYLVTLTDLKNSANVQEEIYKIENVAVIQSKDNTINGLIKIANAIRIISAVILTLLVLISMFIISNTIKLTVHARRKEISIMKYIGATDGFIRWPFIIEGIILGILAAILSIAILAVLYILVTNAMAGAVILNNIGMNLLSFSSIFTLLVLVYLGLGIGIGTLGSALSMRKYLQV